MFVSAELANNKPLRILILYQPIVKVHRVFTSYYPIVASSQLYQFHKLVDGDRRAVVTPFMQGR